MDHVARAFEYAYCRLMLRFAYVMQRQKCILTDGVFHRLLDTLSVFNAVETGNEQRKFAYELWALSRISIFHSESFC